MSNLYMEILPNNEWENILERNVCTKEMRIKERERQRHFDMFNNFLSFLILYTPPSSLCKYLRMNKEIKLYKK